MYVAEQYAMTEEDAWAQVRAIGVGDLVTHGERGLDVTLLPYAVVPREAGEGFSLTSHMGRTNLQWHDEGPAMWVVRGPDAHISATWFDAQAPDARVPTVPTWDYVEVHLFGRLVVHHDEQWKMSSLRSLTQAVEPQWRLDDAGEPLIRRMLPALVGVELVVDRIVGKAKLSQNRSAAEVSRIADRLMSSGHSPQTAEAMRQLALPYVEARQQRVAWAKGLRTEPREGSAAE